MVVFYPFRMRGARGKGRAATRPERPSHLNARVHTRVARNFGSVPNADASVRFWNGPTVATATGSAASSPRSATSRSGCPNSGQGLLPRRRHRALLPGGPRARGRDGGDVRARHLKSQDRGGGGRAGRLLNIEVAGVAFGRTPGRGGGRCFAARDSTARSSPTCSATYVKRRAEGRFVSQAIVTAIVHGYRIVEATRRRGKTVGAFAPVKGLLEEDPRDLPVGLLALCCATQSTPRKTLVAGVVEVRAKARHGRIRNIALHPRDGAPLRP